MENNKNIWLLPTNEPSRLYFNNNDKNLQSCKVDKKSTPLKINQNIYITSDEEIKEGDWVFQECLNMPHRLIKADTENVKVLNDLNKCKKIILTTDQDLINDGVQPIPDEFLEWFVKNPSCERVETKQIFGIGRVYSAYEIIIPKEEPKQETLEEAMSKDGYHESDYDKIWREGVEFGVKWQSERMYSEEEMYSALQKLRLVFKSGVQKWQEDFEFDLDKWFEQFKKK
jgi:translation initiation factor 2 beta subunit (eIF-2beta)/eIF-5